MRVRLCWVTIDVSVLHTRLSRFTGTAATWVFRFQQETVYIEAPVISSSDFTSGVYFLGLTFDYKIDRRKGSKKKKKRRKKKNDEERKKERLDYKLNG